MVQEVKDLLNLSVANTKYVVKYLKYYGYLPEDFLVEDVKDAIVKFQSFFSLKQDGIVGPKTLNAMNERRCGVVDVWHPGLGARGKWNKLNLTYTIQKYPSEFSRAEFKDIIEEAKRSWEKHNKLRLQYTDLASADIVVTTGRGQANGFDGPSGVLAWANLPPGDDRQLLLVFDEDETWLQRIPTAGRGIFCINVAAHELGHNLGLEHSQIRAALMAAYYNPNIWEPQQNDDIPRIQALYGKNDDLPPPPPPTDLIHIQMWVKEIEKIEIPNYRIIKIR